MRREMEERLGKELEFHLDQHTSDLIARGAEPETARRQARISLGGPEQVKERCREARGTLWVEDLWHDFRYALRTFHQKPAFTAVALLTLALGCGATTVMFTVINGVLLKPLPFPDPEHLVTVQERTDKATQFGNLWAFAYPNFQDVQRESKSLKMAASRYGGGTVSSPGEPEYVDGVEISSGLFSVLRIPLLKGRSFLPEEDRPGAPPVAIVSYTLWQRQFGGDPNVLGRQLILEGKPYTVVGVAPARIMYYDNANIYTPLGQNTGPYMQNRGAHPGIRVIGRLEDAATVAGAQAELTKIGANLAAQYPRSNEGRSFVAQVLDRDVSSSGSTLWLLFGAVSILLLIACANVASLLLARAISREREVAMRVALGARRGRLIRQFLTESCVLSLCGGALGVLLAALGLAPFAALWPGKLPRSEEVHLDWHVLTFALAVSLLCGILFGLAPALRVPKRSLEHMLRAGSRAVTGGARRLHGWFVVAEVALAVVLLVSAGILGRTILRASSLDPGIQIKNVLVARMALSPGIMNSPDRLRAAWREALDRVAHVPGVEAVATVDTVPMREGNNQLGYWTSSSMPPRNELPLTLATSVSLDYLKAIGIPLKKGRFFTDQDRLGNALVVAIDEVFAQHAFGHEDPVGKSLWIPDMASGPVTVVGVVGHVRHWGMAGDDDAQVRDQMYYPFAQVPDNLMRRWSELTSIAVRTGVDPLTLLEPLKAELRGATGDQVLYEPRTMEQLAGASLARQRFLLMLFAVFAGLALLLASIGVYGVLAYLTNQRVPEIGVRMALGARATDVMAMVLRQSLWMVAIGVAIGVAGAVAAARLLERYVVGVRSAEPVTFLVMIGVLFASALLASFVPAKRASRVAPSSALRAE
jgi:predicted permease